MSSADLDLATLVGKVALQSVSFFEVSAVRTEAESDEDDHAEFESTADDAEGSGAKSVQYLQTARRDDDLGFRVRLRTEISLSNGSTTVDAAAEYEIDNGLASNISDEVMMEFANEVAIMQLVPYIRQAVADATQRVFGTPLLLPMLQRGELSFTLQHKMDPA